MPRIVVLSQACEIDGVERAEGEIVQVPDGFEEKLVRRTVKVLENEEKIRERRERARREQEKEQRPPKPNGKPR